MTTAKMIVHKLVQGSPEWHQHRFGCWNASDAAAMLGIDPNRTRTELLDELARGYSPEVSAFKQKLFDGGHRREAAARPLGEQVIGEDLYPLVGSREWGLTKPLGASLDGLTMARTYVWEHKQLNEDLRAALPHTDLGYIAKNDAAKLHKRYRVQMEQQCMVTGSDGVLFTASDCDDQGNVTDARHCWYAPDPALRAEILAGWKQLEADAATHVPKVAAVAAVADAVEALPAVMVQVSGQIALKDNFKLFEERLHAFLEHELIRAPKTDQDFATLDVQIKAMKGAEAALAAAEVQMLAQIQTVDQAKKTKDMLAKLVRDNRLMAEKLLSSEKERRRDEIVAGGVAAFRQHVDGLNARLGKPYMPVIPCDFGAAVKGLKSVTSMEDKVATELARAKIAANEVADRIDANLKTLRELATGYEALFPDTRQIVATESDHFRLMVESRIANHKAAENKRLEEERARIRAEEQARAEREAKERAEAEQRDREEAERRVKVASDLLTTPRVLPGDLTEERYTRAVQVVRENNKASISLVQRHLAIGYNAAATLVERMEKDGLVSHPDASGVRTVVSAAANAPVVVPMQRPTTPPTMAAAMPATLTLGKICERFGFTMTADFVRSLGIEPAAVEGNAKKYTEAHVLQLADALVSHVRAVAYPQQAA